jgi:single-strand DNA-binding protein
MAGLPVVTMEGRLGADPDLRFTPSGVAVCSFNVVAQDRRKNESTGEWEDAGDPLWVRVSVWRQAAENCAESLNKGDLVTVVGKLQQRNYTTSEGEQRKSLEINAYSVAASLQFRSLVHSKRAAAQQKTGIYTPDPWSGSDEPLDDEPPF